MKLRLQPVDLGRGEINKDPSSKVTPLALLWVLRIAVMAGSLLQTYQVGTSGFW